MSVQKTRFVRLSGITMPLRIEHGHLAASERIDEAASRIDTLAISLNVEYQSPLPIIPRSMQGAWNFGRMYKALATGDVATVRGPLESVLDAALVQAGACVADQALQLRHAAISADRLGLAVGYPRLAVRTGTPARPSGDGTIVRYVGICDYPLVVNIDHSWCVGEQRVEHADLRAEAVRVTFGAHLPSADLNEHDLAGLYNYAGLLARVATMQGLLIDGPMEHLVDAIEGMLIDDAANESVSLQSSHVEVTRTGYARCVPTIGSIRNYV